MWSDRDIIVITLFAVVSVALGVVNAESGTTGLAEQGITTGIVFMALWTAYGMGKRS